MHRYLHRGHETLQESNVVMPEIKSGRSRHLTPLAMFFLICAILPAGTSNCASLPVGFTETLVAQGLDPTDIVLVPDGRIFVTVKSGKIIVVEDGVLRPGPLLAIEGKVDNYNERGLGHIVLDPDFDTNGFYYLYYTVEGQNHNRISRFKAIGNFSDPTSEVILFELDNLAGTIHNAGDMAFGQDGKLYISTGDGSNSNNAQSLSSALGKILRINPDGTIPEDNPFSSVASGKYKAIYALGFRNPFSLDLDHESGTIFICDVGGGNWEEVNHVEPGKNYGWPGIEGVRTSQALPTIGTYSDPLYTYPHGQGINAGCAVVGAAFYSPRVAQFPTVYSGKFFFADYCNGYIKYADPANGNVSIFAQNIDRPLAIIVDHEDGSMYYVARGGLGGGSEGDNTISTEGTLWKVTYNGSGSPLISVPPQNALVTVGESATFSISATGAIPLLYQWQRDNVDIPGAKAASYTQTNAQITDNSKTFSCIVTNVSGTITSTAATLTVTSNTRPEPQFTWALPGGASLYQGGHTIALSGSAVDSEDGVLSATSLNWKVDFHHDVHFHPALGNTTGFADLTYVIPMVGETSANVWYRIYLTATDNGNPALSKTIFKDVFPQKTDITLLTKPANLTLLLDGQTVTTPHTFSSVVNTTRVVEGPVSQARNDSTYVFNHWSDASTQNAIVFDTPTANKTFTGFFDPVAKGDGTGVTGFYYTNQDKTFDGQPALVRLDAKIDFDWGDGSPGAGISNDHFTAGWIGEVLPQFSDTYTFYLTGDDGIRLWLNDELLIDKWIDQGPTEWSETMQLEEGNKYPLRVEFYENGGGAVAALRWSSSQLVKQIIPTSQLSNDLITGAEHNASAGVSVFPTVVHEELVVKYAGTTFLNWTLVDVLGRTVISGKMLDQFTVNTSGLAAGLYIFKTGPSVFRIIKN